MEGIFSTISAVLRYTDATPDAFRTLVFAAWPESVGELVEHRTEPIGFDNGRLKIAVADKTWKLHLEELAPQILAKLNELCGLRVVRLVEIQIEPTAIKPKLARVEERESDVELSTELRIAASKIPDAKLRSTFLDAASAYFSRD